jgi:hypothetical protein
VKNINIAKHSLKGEYKTVLTKGDGTVVESPWFDNIILNTGLDLLGSPTTGTVLGYLRLGTGTSTPAVTQTNVDAFLVTVNNNIGNTYTTTGSPNYHSVGTIGYSFAQGAVVGNVTELAVGPLAGSTGNCFSRSLIVDNTNTPTALTVTAIDQLTVYYKLTVITSVNDFTGSFVIDGVTYNYTGRKTSIATLLHVFTSSLNNTFTAITQASSHGTNAALGPITGQLTTGTNVGNISVFGARDTYTLGSYTCAQEVTYAADAGHAQPIKGFILSFSNGTNGFQIVLDQAIPKANTNELKIKFGFSWGRV